MPNFDGGFGFFDVLLLWRRVSTLLPVLSPPNCPRQSTQNLDTVVPRSLARVHVHRPNARLALHLAAPPELAHAPLPHRRLHGVVAPAAAEQVAAVHVLRRTVAGAPLGPEGARGGVAEAVVGRLLHVDEVAGGGEAEPGVAQLEPAPAVHADLGGAVVLVSDVVAWNRAGGVTLEKSDGDGRLCEAHLEVADDFDHLQFDKKDDGIKILSRNLAHNRVKPKISDGSRHMQKVNFQDTRNPTIGKNQLL